MRHLLAVLLVPGAFAIAPAAPVPKHLMKNPEPVYYYPTTIGAKWVYDADHILVVSKVEDRKGTKIVTVEQENGKQRATHEVMEVSAAGLARVFSPVGELDPPLVLLKAPFKVGETWAIKTAGVEGVGTITAFEKVTVPAGTFEAVQVEIDYTLGRGKRSKARAWYAPNVGLLKMTDEDDKVIWLLKSFTPGK